MNSAHEFVKLYFKSIVYQQPLAAREKKGTHASCIRNGSSDPEDRPENTDSTRMRSRIQFPKSIFPVETWQGGNTADPLPSGDRHVSYRSQRHPFAFHQAALFNMGIILMMLLLLLSQGCQCSNNPRSSTKDEFPITSRQSMQSETNRMNVLRAGHYWSLAVWRKHRLYWKKPENTPVRDFFGLSGLLLAAWEASVQRQQSLADLAAFTLFIKDVPPLIANKGFTDY